MRTPLVALAVSALLGATGCGLSVKREAPSTVTDISANWNDTDASQVAQAMIGDCLSRPWLSRAAAKLGHDPRVIIGPVRNVSYEHINTDVFVSQLQEQLIDSGKVQFVATSHQRGAIRQERADQDLNASAETRKAMGEEYGADFMLQGRLNAIKQQEGRDEVMYYQVHLELIDMQTNQIVWLKDKQIKKFITRPVFSL